MTLHVEVEFASGLEPVVHEELLASLGFNNIHYLQGAKGEFHFQYAGGTGDLRRLRTVNAVYLRCEFRVRRPKALLGNENFHRILQTIESVLGSAESGERFCSVYVSAAGAQSTVMQRIKHELAAATNLEPADDKGDLVIRIKREPDLWVVLIRISPRPLATRDWRVCDMEGALNGPVAAAMIHITHPTGDDQVANLMCGSGTLLIERALQGTAQSMFGIERDASALNCARRNVQATNIAANIGLIHGDVTQTPLPAGFADVILADLPFGQLIGNHNENIRLYPAVLREAARIAAVQARFVLITHEVRLMERVLQSSVNWTTVHTYRIGLRGLHPRIFVLRKSVASVS